MSINGIVGTNYFDYDPVYKQLIISLESSGICVRCDLHFVAKANMGRWECNYHPKQFNSIAHGEYYGIGTYDCCGRTPLYRDGRDPGFGCVKCDHSLTYIRGWGTDGALAWDPRILDLISPPLHKAIVFDNNPNGNRNTSGQLNPKRVTIFRYDPDGTWNMYVKTGSRTYLEKESQAIQAKFPPEVDTIYVRSKKDPRKDTSKGADSDPDDPDPYSEYKHFRRHRGLRLLKFQPSYGSDDIYINEMIKPVRKRRSGELYNQYI